MRDAKHEPIEFPGQALKVIAAKAEIHLATYRARLARLKRMRKIAETPPAITASPEATQAATAADLESMSPELRKLGIAGGWLVEDQHGIRWASDDEQAAHARRIAEHRIARAQNHR